MLRSPRRIPQRFNRRVTDQTRRLAQHRHQRRRQYWRQRISRLWNRFQRKSDSIKSFVIRFSLWVSGGVVVIIVSVALFSPLLTVREVRIARSDARIDIEHVQRLLRPLFGRHLLFLSSQEVLPLLKQGRPEGPNQRAEPGIPDLASVQVLKRYPSTLSLKLTLDPLIARLQIVDSAGKTATGSMNVDFLTAKGVYVAYSPDQVGSGVLLPLVRVVDWNEPPQPFEALFDDEFLKAMHNAERALDEQFGQKVRSRTVHVRGQEFHLQTAEYALWFDLRSPLEMQLTRYQLFLQSVGKADAKEYVDLRLTDRVVYK